MLKDMLPDYPALVQFLTHAGLDPRMGWHGAAEVPGLAEQVRQVVFVLWRAEHT